MGVDTAKRCPATLAVELLGASQNPDRRAVVIATGLTLNIHVSVSIWWALPGYGGVLLYPGELCGWAGKRGTV
jgi:hypothetical protein